ncbi:MAG TPA: HRDC domain-containing protein [Flavobacteriales bacterium]|nr:HRDC domain-containing protein [Flavobacteriales bacterium]HRQ85368.1 HRDC domain-containing protein [Flavobacteriales bacterium]
MAEAPLIAEPGPLRDLMARLSGEGTLALDTEASSFHRFHERIGLIQLSDRKETWLLDPLALPDMGALGKLLGTEGNETVIHDADYDLRLLKRMYGFRVRHIFDTLIAAELVNEPELGLASLMKKYFNIQLDKRYQKADWTKRPLTQGMLDYAAMDTRNLIALRDVLAAKLNDLGRMAWAVEEFGLLTEIPFQAHDDQTPGFLRIKGAKALRPKELAILRELHAWRDSVAARIDRAPFMVLGNEVMLALSRQPVSSLAELAVLKGIGPSIMEKHAADILAAVERGLAVPKDQWPRMERPKRWPRDPAFDERFKRLKVVRDELAASYELRPGIIAANQLLTDIARAKPADMAALQAVPGLRKYQAQEFGVALLEVV